MQKHRHQEFLRFVNTVEREVPAGKVIHVILDNYATHKHPKVLAWLARHPRWIFHFTPTSSSWLNAVENFFSSLTRQRLQRGVFHSIVALQTAIKSYIEEHNRDPKPFPMDQACRRGHRKSRSDNCTFRLSQTTRAEFIMLRLNLLNIRKDRGLSMANIKTLIKNALEPGTMPEMLRKVATRIIDEKPSNALASFQKLCEEQAIDADTWAQRIDKTLWEEALNFTKQQEKKACIILSKLDVKLGGGGFYALLYFITRRMKPEIIVETGVAAGFSSRAFLTAIKQNGRGSLFSSDFPYFRLKNPKQYVGILIESELQSYWVLKIGSDRVNLPKIKDQIGAIDIFHYDSDKSRRGRDFAIETLKGKFSDQTLIIFDDIQNNLHFRDYASKRGGASLIFEYGGKYIGILVPKTGGDWMLT